MTKVLIIVTAIVVVAAIGVGAYYISGQQRRAYDEGHAAYLGGDCVKATGPLEDAADSDMDEKLADKARAELDECQALLAADALDTQGRQSAAVLSYSKFVVTYPASPIVDVAVSKGQALLSKSPPERLGDLELCNALDALDAQGFVAAPDDVLPPLLLSCGEAYANAGDYVAAIAVLDRIRSDYPGHPLMADVEDAYVRITLAEADATGAGALPSPSVEGPTGSGDGPAVVVIRNASTERLTIVFRGPGYRPSRSWRPAISATRSHPSLRRVRMTARSANTSCRRDRTTSW